jgi:GNAT superfamily N-acetyltransferase
LSLSLPLGAVVDGGTADSAQSPGRKRRSIRMLLLSLRRIVVRGEEGEAMLTRARTVFAAIPEGIGDEGSRADAERVVLRDGSSVVIRPLVAGNEAAVTGWFAALGVETRYARFLATLKQLSPRTVSELARVDHVDHEALAALAPDGTTVAIARYIRTANPRLAEVAVADAWRGRGIASMLLERLTTRAQSVGIERFEATCLAPNHTILRMLSRLGPRTIGAPVAGVVDVQIDLMGTDIAHGASASTPRASGRTVSGFGCPPVVSGASSKR